MAWLVKLSLCVCMLVSLTTVVTPLETTPCKRAMLPPRVSSSDSPRSDYPNVALGKGSGSYQGPRTLSSSTPSGKAVDGDHGYGPNVCAHTETDAVNYWVVDLGKLYRVNGLSIISIDTFNSYLQNYTVDLFREDPQEAMPDFPEGYGVVCLHQESTIGDTWKNLECGKPVVGRYLRIVKYGFNELILCEVEIFAEDWPITTRSFKKNSDNSAPNDGVEVPGKFRSAIQCASYLIHRTKHQAFHFDPLTGHCSTFDSDKSVW